MTEFAENLQLLVGTMGYKLFKHLTKKVVPKQEQYFISAARGADATAVLTSEGIVVRKGSKIATSGKAVWEKRALRTDLAIQTAIKDNLPVRVIVLEGARRGVDQSKTEASRVEKRLLDPVIWAVTKYDWNTGQCTVTRGAPIERFADQFSIPHGSKRPVEQRVVSGHVFV